MLSLRPHLHPFSAFSPLLASALSEPSARLYYCSADDDHDADNDNNQLSSSPAPVTLRPSYRARTTDAGTTISVDLPGVAKHDVSVEVNGRRIAVSGARYRPAQESEQAQSDGAPASASAPAKPSSNGEERSATTRTDSDDHESLPKADTAQQRAPQPAVVYKLDLKLDSRADPAAAAVQSYADGVLTLHVPRAAESAPRTLPVH